jgi:hypothetical protein
MKKVRFLNSDESVASANCLICYLSTIINDKDRGYPYGVAYIEGEQQFKPEDATICQIAICDYRVIPDSREAMYVPPLIIKAAVDGYVSQNPDKIYGKDFVLACPAHGIIESVDE